jgi:hypothetical protein
MDLSKLTGQMIQGALALAVVVGWIAAAITGVGDSPELRDAALLVLGFFFGGSVHSAGVVSGAAAAALAGPE